MRKKNYKGRCEKQTLEKFTTVCKTYEPIQSAYAILLLPKIRESIKEHDTVLDGLYSWDELVVLREEFGDELKVIAVTADRSLRYNRLTTREFRPLTNEEALKRDVAEIENLAKGGPISLADYYILNNGTKEEYIERLEEIINEM